MEKVGHRVGKALEAQGALRALERAVATLGEGEQPVHHSDCGCQYGCRAFVIAPQRHKTSSSGLALQNSVTQAFSGSGRLKFLTTYFRT